MINISAFFTGAALVFGCGLPLLGYSQAADLTRDPRNYFSGYPLPPPATATLQGTPFLLAAWAPATIWLLASTQPIPATLKYDVYRQEFRVRRPQGDSVVVPLDQVREFNLTDSHPARRFICYPQAALPAEGSNSCGEVLFDGSHAQLMKFVRKKVAEQAVSNGSYASNALVSVLTEQTHYYLRWPADGHFTPLKLKRASLEQALAGQPAALAALRARKGNLGSEADLTSAFGAVEPLLTSPSR